MVDLQATERALRIGQERDVAIYRLVCEETVEEKIYHRQVFKKYMADRILSDPTRRRLFEKHNLYELFTVPERQKKPEPLEDGEIDLRKAPKGILKLSPTAINEDKKLRKYLKKQKKQLLKVKEEETRKTKKDLTEELLTKICQTEEIDAEKAQKPSLQQIELQIKAGRRVDKLIRDGGMRLTTCEYEPVTLDENGLKKQIIRTFEAIGHCLTIDDLFDPLSEILETKEQMVLFKKALKEVAILNKETKQWSLAV